MTCLDLSPAITAIRSRPDEFEILGNTLNHTRSRHSFTFLGGGEVRVYAACDCATLPTSPEQGRVFHDAFVHWHATYWRPLEINREFASHFRPPSLWKRLLARLLKFLLSSQQPVPHSSSVTSRALPSAG